MNREYSCGAVVFTRKDGQILFVVVQEQSGAYSFPKGHMENNETELETARREIFEETGLNPDFLPGFREEDEFAPAEKPGTRKRQICSEQGARVSDTAIAKRLTAGKIGIYVF